MELVNREEKSLRGSESEVLLVSFGPKNDLVAEVLRSYWPIGHVSFMSHHLLYFQGWMRRIQVVTQTLRDTILCCVHKSTKYPVYLE